MTTKQTALYFREWGSVRGYLKARRLPEPDRHALHVQALGHDKSSRDFNNADFDQVLAVFRAVYQPANVGAQLRQIGEPSRRKAWKIRELLKCLALYLPDPDAYAREIIRDTVNRGSATKVERWQDLSDMPDGPSGTSQLDRLIMDLSRRLNGARGFRARAGDSVHDMHTRAGLQCRCAQCADQRQPARALVEAGDNEPF